MEKLHNLLPWLLALLFACSGPGAGEALDLGGDTDAATNTDLPASGDLGTGAACIGKKDCDCLASSATCQPIAQSCWCPTQCNGQLCACGGGEFLGCAPRASGCEAVVSCRPAGRAGPQDARGCIACTYENACPQAAEALRQGCPAKRAMLTALTCDRSPDCVTRCINDLKTCEDIGCGLCAACGCGATGPFEQCVFKCQGG